MTTKHIIIKNEKELEAIREVAEILKRGGIVAIPTETVYGLAANALDKDAVAKNHDMYSSIDIIDMAPSRLLVENTDMGKKIQKKINDLRALVDAFRRGEVK